MRDLYKKIKYLLLFALLVFQLGFAGDTRLKFDNVFLYDVLTELSKFYSINFIYQDKLVENKKVTCSLNEQNSDIAIKEMLNIASLSFEKINENTYVLYRKSQSLKSQLNKGTVGITEEKSLVFTPPRAITKISIPYPELAKVGGFEGSVDMKILIDANGDVETVKIQNSSNSIILDKAAVEYTKQIKFIPAQRDSQAVSVWSKWKIIFDLVPSDTSYSEVVFKNTN